MFLLVLCVISLSLSVNPGFL